MIVPETPHGGAVVPRTVRVQFGDGVDNVGWYTARTDEPVIRNVRIHGFTDSINPRTVSRRDYFLTSQAVVLRDNGVTRRIPDGARTLTEAIVVAVVREWNRRSDRAELVRAAACHAAPEQVRHEQSVIDKAEAELRAVRSERAAVRLLIRQVAGLVRRRRPDVLAASAAAVRLPFVGQEGIPMGVLTVREKEVNVLPGRVVYEVEGGRVRGMFTVGPDIYGHSQAVPRGVYISYSRPTDASWFRDCTGEPSVNGVRLSGGWSHGGRSGDITPVSPERLPAQVRLGPRRSITAPEATARRASAVLRALALHYLSRPDEEALRVAAGKHRAGMTRAAAREKLSRLRKHESALTSRLRRHRGRKQQYLDLFQGGGARRPVPVVERRPPHRALSQAA
ncbi:hypothetical protein [Streptomyces yaizuensis]|uniref:Uncharacterized protein n=1 Tax=Streptomyces yaizuensis TaxID=2989713 RepID=A0ABQ5P634_9ACTN|nr:hypothetical protein [Streptomyces sp. YSPA8]GLF98053.1 hypothetical protein SYYSPA8_27170 [Streptomyces sp. YSPA8]